MFLEQNILRIPGPTPIPPIVQRAMTQPMIGHRDEDTKNLFNHIQPRLKPLFGTNQDVLILTGSGTGALETAVVNTTRENDEVLVLVTGSFGERFASICRSYQLKTHRLDTTWGEAIDPEQIKDYLKKHPTIKVVFATFCETSTGVLNPIQELATIIRNYSDALFIVDGVSSVGGVEAKMEEWGIDLLVTGSQKAFMLPPGLAFMAVSEKAWGIIEQNPRPRFYFDLRKYRDHFAPFTPALSLLFGLKKSLDLLEAEGLENVFKRHKLMMKMTREACRTLDLPLLTEDDHASPTVTSVIPNDFEASKLRKVLKQEFNMTIAGGQQQMKDKIFRLGHMGYCSPADVLQMISLLEVGLQLLGVNRELGKGTEAAQSVLLEGRGQA